MSRPVHQMGQILAVVDGEPTLNRLSQSHCAPLLGPEHWQVSQALDAEAARQATFHRGFRQDGVPALEQRLGQPVSGVTSSSDQHCNVWMYMAFA